MGVHDAGNASQTWLAHADSGEDKHAEMSVQGRAESALERVGKYIIKERNIIKDAAVFQALKT